MTAGAQTRATDALEGGHVKELLFSKVNETVQKLGLSGILLWPCLALPR